MTKRLTDHEARVATDAARKKLNPGNRAVVAVGYEPLPNGAEIVFWRNGKRLGAVPVSPGDALRLTMAWDTKRDIMLWRLCFFPNADGSLVLGLLKTPDPRSETLTNTTLPPPAADHLLDQLAYTGGLGLGLALSTPRGVA